MDSIYKAILEDTLAGYWDWNITTGNLYFSTAFKAVLGYADSELDVNLQTWQNLVYVEDRPLFNQAIQHYVESKSTIPCSVELRYVHKNGTLVWFICTGRVTEWNNDVAMRMTGCHVDISWQKKTQHELQITEQHFKGAFEYSTIGMAILSPQGKWLKVNKKLCSMVGYTETELLNISFHDITHPEDLESDLYLLAQLINKEIDSYHLEKRYFHKNGTIIWVLLTVSLVRDEQDKPLHIVAQVEDITQQKKAETELKVSRDRYSKIFRSVQDVFFRLNADGIIIEISPSIEKYEGYKREQFIGKHAQMFYYDPNDRVAVVETLQKQGKVDDFGVRLKTPDGQFVYTSINAYVIYDEQGNFLGSEGTIRDITARVKAEDALKERDALLTKLSEQIPGVIYQLQMEPGGHSYFPFVSNAVTELYGLTADEIRHTSAPIFERVHPDDIKGLQNSLVRSYQTLSRWDYEYRINVPGAETKWLRTTSRPEKQFDGSVIWHGYVTDITEHKLKEQQLQNTFDLVTEQNNRLINFAYIISHNLRTHSGNFEMLVNLLFESDNEAEKAEFVQLLKKVSGLLSETIMHLNEVVSIQTSIKNQLSILNLYEYVDKAVQVLTVNTKPGQVIIKNNIDPYFEVKYNPAYLESIVFNFLSNSIKYGHPGRQTIIQVSAHYDDEHPILEFTDNGLGMDLVKNRHKLFGMYRTFHNNPDAKGIGLYITECQVEAMGGKIEVVSQVNVGTTFTVTLH